LCPDALYIQLTGKTVGEVFPALHQSLVRDWASAHQQELLGAFESAVALQPPGRIAPLE
jgi:hypothetical protein